jgi:hypothetical protein
VENLALQGEQPSPGFRLAWKVESALPRIFHEEKKTNKFKNKKRDS